MAETGFKVILAAMLTLMFSVAAQAQDAADVEERYKRSCAVCHAAGAAGAPKTGVVAEWEPRLAKGMDTLVAAVENGLNAMPPKGMCFDCSSDDYKALILLMSKAK